MKSLIIAVLVLCSFGCSANGQYSEWYKDDAKNKFKAAVKNHTEPVVSQYLRRLLDEQKVLLKFDDVPSIHSLLTNDGHVVIVASIRYINDNSTEAVMLNLYGEAIYIQDHFAGKRRMIPPSVQSTMKLSDIARMVWDVQWREDVEKWKLAKKWKQRHLMPQIDEATRLGETPQSFFTGFGKGMENSDAVKLDPKLRDEFRKIYRAKLVVVQAQAQR